ncbi:Homeobox-leucine zipper protein ATHB-12 [Bienertia sinuspersici]
MQISPIPKAYKLLHQQNSISQLQNQSTEIHISHTSMDINPEESIQINKNSNKKRFSDDQIKSLESMFSSESRPGPKTKKQIADQLGLHPRQVSVWFQNRRARTKSKQTERDYSVLKARYDSLASKLEVLKNENQCLIVEVERLRGLKGSPKDSTNEMITATCSSNGESISLSSPEKHIARPEDYIHNIICETNFEHETDDQENINMIESADGSLASSRNNDSLETMHLIEHNYLADWLEFWT